MIDQLTKNSYNNRDSIRVSSQYLYYFKLFPGYGELSTDGYFKSSQKAFYA